MVEGPGARQRLDRVGHPHRRPIAQHGIERWTHHGPQRRGGQARRTLGDQHIDDVRSVSGGKGG